MEDKIFTFIIDEIIHSPKYSMKQILDLSEEDILESMEVCTCQFNESNNHCECEPVFANSSITGIIIKVDRII